MNIVIISESDNGGAGLAVYRTYLDLKKKGHNCKVLVKSKTRNDKDIYSLEESSVNKFINRILLRLSLFFFKKKYMFFDLLYFRDHFRIQWLKKIVGDDTDIVIIAWGARFINLNDLLKIKNKKIRFFSYLVDMHSLTGGCHYSYGCQNYIDSNCDNCPGAKNYLAQNLVSKKFLENQIAINELEISAFSAVKFINDQAKKSKRQFSEIFQISVDDNFKCFTFDEDNNARDALFLGSYNPKDERKGYSLFVAAARVLLTKYLSNSKRLKILVPKNHDFPELKHDYIELIQYEFAKSDIELSYLYSRSKLFVSTSVDDTGPAMIYEALCSGVPVISTRTGAAEELLLEEELTGFIIGNKFELADKIYEIMFGDSKVKASKIIENQTKNKIFSRPELNDYI